MPDPVLGQANRNQPSNAYNSGLSVAGGFPVPIRVDFNGNQVVSSLTGSKMTAIADEGNYFAAMNPTPGTGIAGAATPTAFAETAALMFLRNSDAQTGKRLFLDYILLTVTAPGTSSTSFNYVMTTDVGSSRYTSGGTAITPVNTNMDTGVTPGIDVLRFGAVVLAAQGTQRRVVDQGQLRNVIKAVGDKYLFTFGASTPAALAGVALDGAAVTNINIPCPPIVLGAGHSFMLHEWSPAQTVAAAYEVKMGFYIH